MIAFKIVRKNGNGLFSIGESDYTIHYRIGETAYAKIGKIYIFKHLFDVKAWINSKEFMEMAPVVREQFVVVKGEARNISKPQKVAFMGVYINQNENYLSDLYYINTGNVERFWTAKQLHKSTKNFAYPPPNKTLTCDAFLPIEIL